jgi:hypothetical protein
VGDPLVSRTLELIERQADLTVRVQQLRGAVPRRPRRGVTEPLGDLVAPDAVVPRVGRCAWRIFDPTPGDDPGDDRRDIADLVVLRCRANVEGLVVDRIAWRIEHGKERPRDVPDVDDRTPWAAVALDQHPARRERPSDEVVEDDVEAKPGGHAVGRRVAQACGAEGVVRERRKVLLDEHLRSSVRRHGP